MLKFIHITKTAGTSIERAAKTKNILWGSHDRDTYYNIKHCLLPKHISCKNLNSYDWFTVVRNPYTRIISSVNWAHKRYMQKNNKNQFVKYYAKIYKDYSHDKKKIIK